MKPTTRRYTACVAAALALLLTACGAIQIEGGAPFDPGKLESALSPGISTQLDVRQALGEPYGKGGAYLPFHDSPRSAWTYFYERGNVDLGKGGMNDERVYLFVFFAGDKFDSYMWFTSTLASVKK
jgi:hypothetical protein